MRGVLKFIHHEASGGIFLIAAAIAAVVLKNSPIAYLYDALLTTPVTVQIGSALDLRKPLLLWINDGLMAVFFLLVGLEIKREVLEGELSSRDQILLPAVAAIGGMALPAAIYAALNAGDPSALAGWAIPAATDIAFALGVLALLGSRVPPALKVFLLTLAILDDLGAIAIIALFYTQNLSLLALAGAAASLIALFAMNRAKVTRAAPYIMIGILLWIFVLKSGVHATLAGVALGFAIPMRREDGPSPLKAMEHGLHPYVAFFIMPVFAFANAGVSLAGFAPSALLQPVSLGIAAGLVVGKQVGVFGAVLLLVKTGLARLPAGTDLGQIYGAACLAGIGFTMSLFIGSLSFADPEGQTYVRIGVIAGSLLSAAIGFAALRLALRDSDADAKASTTR